MSMEASNRIIVYKLDESDPDFSCFKCGKSYRLMFVVRPAKLIYCYWHMAEVLGVKPDAQVAYNAFRKARDLN